MTPSDPNAAATIDPARRLELERLAASVDRLATKSDAEAAGAPVARGMGFPPPALQQAEVFDVAPQVGATTNNWCAQAAVASTLIAWGAHRGMAPQDLINYLYRNFPPNILGGNGGSSPDLVASMLEHFGLAPRLRTIGAWLPGGFLNLANQAFWQPHVRTTEGLYPAYGKPMICLVDSGAVGGDWFSLHYVVYAVCANGTAVICNAFNQAKAYAKVPMPVDNFHQAWEVRFLPALHFVCITVG